MAITYSASLLCELVGVFFIPSHLASVSLRALNPPNQSGFKSMPTLWCREMGLSFLARTPWTSPRRVALWHWISVFPIYKLEWVFWWGLLQGLRETSHQVSSASINSCSLLSIFTLPPSCNYIHKPAHVRDIKNSKLTGQAALINW